MFHDDGGDGDGRTDEGDCDGDDDADAADGETLIISAGDGSI